MKTLHCERSILVTRLAIVLVTTIFVAGTFLTLSTNAGRNSEKDRKDAGRKTQHAQEPVRANPTPTPVNGPAPASTPTPVPATRKSGLQTESVLTGLMAASGGTLTARMFSSVPANPINLTSQGTVDWTHWGNGGPTIFNHKSTGNSQISNYTILGTSQIFWLNDNPTGFSWGDGTPTQSVSNIHRGVYAIDPGNGFQFTVPADTNIKTLRVYLGLWRARGRLEASLSDGSAPTYIDTSLVNQTTTSNGTYTISFAAASAGQTLTIKYTCQSSFLTGSGNVTLEAATLVNGPDPDILPNVNMSSPSDEATFNAGDAVALRANAFDLDGSISGVQFYVDGFLLGAGTATGTNEYGLTWNGAFAGPHTITAVATDNEGGMTTSQEINVTVFPAVGGTLTGKLYSPSTTLVNLTTEGTLDWAHWGNGGAQVFDHKAAVTPQISNVTMIGNASASWLQDNPTPFTWTDGVPTGSASNNRTGIFVSSAGNGFEVTLPADTTFKTVRIYTGFWYAQAKLEAVLSDGSAPNFVDTSLGGTATQNGIYALSYRAASDGETLRLRYTVFTDNNPPLGNVALEAITLSSGGPPTVSVSNPADGAIVSVGPPATFSATASDPSGISKVEFFQGGTLLGERTTTPYSINWTPTSGVYTLSAVATNNKGIQATSTPVTVTANGLPVVNAGYNQSISFPGTATLFGTVSDDGQPVGGSITLSWTKVSGPGTVSFGSPTSALTTATFSSEGDYVLRLTASDSGGSASSDVSVGVHSAVTMPLNSTADAHVRDGASASTNFGTAATIEVQTGATGENRDAYFTFDLTTIGDINNGKLRIFAATSAAGSVTTSVYPVATTSWSEGSINWNNRPALGSAALSSVTVNGTTFAWYELDVTNYLIQEKNAGRNVVSLALHNPSSSTIYIKINSKEAASNKPQLSVSTAESSFVVSQTSGTVRNNLSALVGMKFNVGTVPVVVTSLGRVFVAGNTGTHTVKLVTASSGADVAGGSVSLNLASGTASNGFKYASLAAPVTLAANTAYYLVTQETSGGDQWYDSNTVVATTNVATVNNAVQKPNNTWQSAGSTNNSFGPVNFKYVSKTPATTITYHLHAESSSTTPPPALLKLTTADPDAAITILQTAQLKSQANGEKLISGFDTQGPILGRAGYIPSGSTTTVSLWMRNTGTVGTMFPRAKLYLNNEAGTSLCTATGTTALSSTLTKYTISCSTSSDILVAAQDRLYLWVGVNLTAGSTSKNFTGELDIEGTVNGNYDSQLSTVLPLVPTIYAVTPNIGQDGTSVTISGTNFGALQGSSTVSFNGLAASVTSWSANTIATSAPALVTSGPVVVTVNSLASNGVTFTVGSGDSDGDGLPDAWELQYFGNLLQGANDDPDGDGTSNLLEYLQGRNPTVGLVDPSSLINLKVYSPFEP